jgi:hypothetical protein
VAVPLLLAAVGHRAYLVRIGHQWVDIRHRNAGADDQPGWNWDALDGQFAAELQWLRPAAVNRQPEQAL